LDDYVIAYANKTIIKINGLKIKGLNANKLEVLLSSQLQSDVRIIGVTGDSIVMDVYGVDEKQILKDEAGMIHAISLFEGITATEVAEMAYAKKIVPVNFNEIPRKLDGCAGERWAVAANE